MELNHRLYLAISSLAPFLAAILLYELAIGNYQVAWMSAVAIVLCMESRVQLVGRTVHDLFFWLHILGSVPFLVALSLLAFGNPNDTLLVAAVVFLVMSGIPGAVLWQRGMREVLHTRTK